MADHDQHAEMSDEQTAKLIHFHDVTQIDDLDHCKNILNQFDWNMEQAVQSTFTDTVRPSEQSRSSTPLSTSSASELRHRVVSPGPRSFSHEHLVPRQMVYVGGNSRRPPEGFLGWSYFLIFSPIRYTFNQVFSILRFVFRLFFPDPRERITDPHGDVISFISDFREKYPNHPEFFRGTYGKARDEAKKQIRFLLIYLHDSGSEETELFCRDTLCHPLSVEFLNRKVIFWGCSIAKPEGYKVSKIIRNPTYPLLALVCFYQNQMTVVGRLQGLITSDGNYFTQGSGTYGSRAKCGSFDDEHKTSVHKKYVRTQDFRSEEDLYFKDHYVFERKIKKSRAKFKELITRLTQMMNVYEPALISARADKDTRDQNILIRREQDEAYQLSLQKDKEKVNMKMKQEEEERKEKEKKEKIKREKDLRKQICLDRKARCKKELAPEPVAGEIKLFELIIKLPNGTRLKRKFQPTDTVKTLHDFIYAQDDAPFSFQVFSNFPRRQLPGCNTSTIDDVNSKRPTLEEIGLNRNDTLFVQTLHSDEEESDDDLSP